ncbi:LOW QUALITY PROTEIN: apolipoprotein F-like [Anomalospiza imberbis]|uniref:LOW QUALITY PROTEIN: apolipoprotein F-like n=1 Tax=Anomalospiza imberbis TaxID=187417 RepID=UPI00358FA498
MPRVLLFLPLLVLSRAMAVSVVTPGLAAGDRALLAELVGPAEPIPPRAPGVPCRALRPDALPGFSRLPPLPRGLARAAMALALRGAGCALQAEAEALELARELGPPTAAALLRGLARVPGALAPRPLALLLLGLARSGGSACVDPAQLRTPTPGVEPTPPLGQGGREFPGFRPCRGAVRRRREDKDACSPAGEREAHQVLEWVPGVSIFYNLGTSVYFAFQGCEAVASTRALEAAEDLGYAGLAALTGGLGGPVAMGVQLGLQPGLKAGVRALIGYFTSAGEPSPVPTAHSGAVVIV